MEQEVFNQLLANSPIVVVLLYYARKIGDLSERIATLEGFLYENHRKHKK